jgi:predicted GH43/DUF377 family glycosyl hydrolase
MNFDYAAVSRPLWFRDDVDLRDPAVFVHDGTAYLYFTHYDFRQKRWHVGLSETQDFREFSPIRLVTPEGYASPGNVLRVGDEFVLCYQQYREFPHTLCIARSRDLREWSSPEVIFNTGTENRWNADGRVIDPFLVESDGCYYCYYVGSDRWGKSSGHNYLGVAVSADLVTWTDLSPDEPVIGVDYPWEEPDGNENNCVLWHDGRWVMLYSASLRNQKIAWATSDDLLHWEKQGLCDVPVLPGTEVKAGAPFVIEGLGEPGTFHMIYQGENPAGRVGFFLLESTDLVTWR